MNITNEEIRITTRVLQSIDIEMERVFNEKHAKEVQRQLRHTESDVSNLVDDFLKNFPSNFLLMNGNGYRILLTILSNTLLIVGREDLSKVVMDAKVSEN